MELKVAAFGTGPVQLLINDKTRGLVHRFRWPVPKVFTRALPVPL